MKQPRQLMAAALGSLLLAAACWLFAPLAIVLAWPLFFGVPAYLLITRVAPELSPAGRTGVAVVAGIELSAHLTYLVARLFGYGTVTVFAVTAVLAFATWVLATQRLPWLDPPRTLSWEQTLRALQTQRAAFALAGLAAAIVGGVLALSAWHQTPQGWASGGWNWSDFLVHVSISQSIAHGGNFPPQVPYFSGAVLSYHWFGDFHAAVLATVAQMDVIPPLLISNAVCAGALVLVVYELASALFRNHRAALLAATLVTFGGGLGFMRLFIDLAQGKGSVLNLVSTTTYDSNFLTSWPYFRISSVFDTGLLAQRATAYGLPMAVAAVLLLHGAWGRNRAGVAAAGVIAALEAPFQFFFFPAIYLVLGIMLLARRAWRDRGLWDQLGLLLLPLIYGLAFIIIPVLQQRSTGVVHAVLGWPDAPFHDGIPAVLFFYVTNLGLPLLLALVALTRRSTPQRLFLGGWMLALFLVPNLVVVSAVTFDANKFFQLMWIPLAMLAAWLVRNWAKPLLVGVIVLATFTNVLIAVWHIRDPRVVLSNDQEVAARWIEANTPDRALFVTDAFLNNPIDLAGRLRLTTFGPYVSNLGYDPKVREAEVQAVYCDGDVIASEVMRREGATYVLSSGGLLPCKVPTNFDRSSLFQLIYRGGTVSVWHLRS